MEKVRRCAKCGVEIICNSNRQTYCPACARVRKLEQDKKRKLARQRQSEPRRCPICGGPVTERRRRYCAHCRSLSRQERERQPRRKKNEKLGLAGLSVQELAALAKQYRPPYGTYGKLKSYIDVNGKLPPDEFRRSR